jgi:hypothetical protein
MFLQKNSFKYSTGDGKGANRLACNQCRGIDVGRFPLVLLAFPGQTYVPTPHRTHLAGRPRPMCNAACKRSRACLRLCTKWTRLAQVKAGLPQLMQLTVSAPIYQMSLAQASWCLCVCTKEVWPAMGSITTLPTQPTLPHPPHALPRNVDTILLLAACDATSFQSG